jgi:hypothetical protein
LALAVAGLASLAAGAGASTPRPAAIGRSTATATFGWLAATTAPASWRALTVPSGSATLSLPPRFHRVRGDLGTLSAAFLGTRGTDLGYLDVTPRQGDETLTDWAGFRLAHLRQDDAISVRLGAEVISLRTGRARRSCVIDDYLTAVGHHRFHEVACLVVADGVTSVVLAATPAGDPAHVWGQLERAVAAYPDGSREHGLASATPSRPARTLSPGRR